MKRQGSHPTGRSLRFESVESRLLLSSSPAAWTGLDQVRAEHAFTGQGQTVAVIDSGIDYRHAALGGGIGPGQRVVGGYDFTERDADPNDDGPGGGHGTHVAGILASADPAHLGVVPGADVVALRVYDDSGASWFSAVNEALVWVHAHRNDFRWPITTVNLSLGSNTNAQSASPTAMLEKPLAQLQADGIFVTVSAGNNFAAYGQPGLSYPANSPYVVPVAAADAAGSLLASSQRSARAIAAPGQGVLSTVPDYAGNRDGAENDYGRWSGTSMAASYVAGASMLLRQAYQAAGVANVAPQTLYNQLMATADTIRDPVTGQDYRRLNLDRAVDAILPPAPLAVAAASSPAVASSPAAKSSATPVSPVASATGTDRSRPAAGGTAVVKASSGTSLQGIASAAVQAGRGTKAASAAAVDHLMQLEGASLRSSPGRRIGRSSRS